MIIDMVRGWEKNTSNNRSLTLNKSPHTKKTNKNLSLLRIQVFSFIQCHNLPICHEMSSVCRDIYRSQ
jgi:hypothetical protein